MPPHIFSKNCISGFLSNFAHGNACLKAVDTPDTPNHKISRPGSSLSFPIPYDAENFNDFQRRMFHYD